MQSIRPGNVRISHDDLQAPQSDLEVNSKLTVSIYLVVFLLDFHSDFIMLSTSSFNFLYVRVYTEIMARFFKVSHWSYIQFFRRNISYIYIKVNEQKA